MRSSRKILSLKPKISSSWVTGDDSEPRFPHHNGAAGQHFENSTDQFDAVMKETDNAQAVASSNEGAFLSLFAKFSYFYESVETEMGEMSAALTRNLGSSFASTAGRMRWHMCSSLK